MQRSPHIRFAFDLARGYLWENNVVSKHARRAGRTNG